MNPSLQKLDAEIARLQKVRALLANEGPKRGRPAIKTTNKPDQLSARKERIVSPETKERMRQG